MMVTTLPTGQGQHDETWIPTISPRVGRQQKLERFIRRQRHSLRLIFACVATSIAVCRNLSTHEYSFDFASAKNRVKFSLISSSVRLEEPRVVVGNNNSKNNNSSNNDVEFRPSISLPPFLKYSLQQTDPATEEKKISYTLYRQSASPRSTLHNQFSCVPKLPSPQNPPEFASAKMTERRIRLGKRRELSKWFADRLRFTTSITLQNIKVIVMGDSVGMQLSQMLQEAAGARAANKAVFRRLSGKYREGLHIAAPLFPDPPPTNTTIPQSESILAQGEYIHPGYSVVAGWRITDFFLRENENKPLPNAPGGGWVRSDVHNILNYTYQYTTVRTAQNMSTTSPYTATETLKTTAVAFFDVLIFRISSAWMGLRNITHEKMAETVMLAQELFGVNVVIFVNMPFDNAIRTREDFDLYQEKNNLVKTFVANSGRQYPNITATVLVSDFGRLTDELMEANARDMGINVSNPYFGIDESLKYLEDRGIRKSIPLVCADRVAPGSEGCIPNLLSYDGMHWCMSSIGGRISANLACLLACSYNNDKDNKDENELRECERHCNDQFMSLKSIPGFMFDVQLH